MRKIYPYLNDSDFLYQVDTERLQNQLIKITLLDWNEQPLDEIQGIATGGSVSLNGSSAIRRTCNLSMVVKDVSTGRITDVNNLISINKKIYLEVGIVNKTNKYKEYPILWYPQGVMVVSQCSINTALGQGTTLSAQLKDKMCLLNGECGGMITSAVVLDHYETIDASTGGIIEEQPTFARIIRELVNHFGGEQLGRIIINDLPERIKSVLRWTGSNPIYLATKDSSHLFTTNEAEARAYGGTVREFHYGQDIGYEFTDFVCTSELTANAGDSVCTILDKIKNMLGNYEYYYDIWGNFIWQEIKNYLNTTQAKVELDKMKNEDYMVDIARGKSTYKFNDSKLIMSYANTPQYNRIKNDYVVWGIRETVSGNKVPIRYHLAIDKKPAIGNVYDVFFYNDPTDGLKKAKCPIKYDNIAQFPEVGVEGLFYMSLLTGIIYKWDSQLMTYVALDGATYEEYNTRADFPEIGEEGVVYLDTSENKRYSWKLNPESIHYQTVAAEISALKADYDMDMSAFQADIDILQKQIDGYNADIEEVEQACVKWRVQKRAIDKEIDGYNQEKTELQNEISEWTRLKNNYQTVVDNKNAEIAALNEELSQTTDPERIAELIQLIDNATTERDAAQRYVDLYTGYINDANAEIAVIDSQLAEAAVQLAAVMNELQPFLDIENSIQNNINALQSQIDLIQSQMDVLTESYTDARADLLAAQHEYMDYVGESLVQVQATDWRSELYLAGVAAEPLGLESNYYYPELEAEWPKLYNLQADSYVDPETGHTIYIGAFYEDILDNPWDVDYWLDFIDSEAAISSLNISNIGRRSITENNDDYNCVFEADIPDIVIIEAGDDAEEKRKECEDRNQDYCQVSENIYEMLSIGGLHNSCFNEIKNLLWSNTNYNSSISLSTIPIFHLDTNIRITVNSPENDIQGDYMVSNISIPLTISGNMSISATQVQNKL